MTDWTSGYVADIGYTYGYYAQLNPLRIKLVFINAGLVAPNVLNACELGFGQGMSANVHAAASLTPWYGTDFNPAHAGFAQELAAASGAGAQLHDDSFAEFFARTDLPDFDFIGLHGIWTWVSNENRALIVDFIRRKLRVGGVVYISYNTQPGWACFAPVRHLMTQHADSMGVHGQGILSRIDGALDFTEKMLATHPSFAQANPAIAERVTKIKGQDRQYVAHEYFNRDWEPMHFKTLVDWLAPAKLEFACSAHPTDHVDAMNLTEVQQQFLKDIPDAVLRESVRDFMVTQHFRRDYWVKGARKIGGLELTELAAVQRVMLVTQRADVPYKATGALGQANLKEAIYGPVLDALADHKPKTLGQLLLDVKDKGINFIQLLQAVTVLNGEGHVAAVQDDAVVAKAKKHTDMLNQHLMNKARSTWDMAYLASPVTGGAVMAGRFVQLFLLAAKQGKKRPAEWGEFAWQVLASQVQKIVKEGKSLDTAEENIAELTTQAYEFHKRQWALFKALGIV